MMQYININKELIPYTFNLTLDKTVYEMHIDHNADHDFFTMSLYHNGRAIVDSEKIVYGWPLFHSVRVYIPGFPVVIPADISGQEDRVTFENLNQTVFLYMQYLEV